MIVPALCAGCSRTRAYTRLKEPRRRAFTINIPKRKLEQADDLEDFDFEDEADTEELVNEDDIAEDEETKNNI